MKWHSLSMQEWMRAIGIGIGVAILTAVIMVTALKSGLSLLPKPLGLAFAETVLGRALPLPVAACAFQTIVIIDSSDRDHSFQACSRGRGVMHNFFTQPNE